jgi:hypothetical protein
MKKTLLNFLLGLSIIIGISSCGIFKSGKMLGCGASKDDSETELIMRAYSSVINSRQLDSLCSADNLSRNIEEDWMRNVFTDFESNESIVKYIWIKSVSEDTETTYILVPCDTLYTFTKRVISSEKVED